jgi:hypothetical protein
MFNLTTDPDERKEGEESPTNPPPQEEPKTQLG